MLGIREERLSEYRETENVVTVKMNATFYTSPLTVLPVFAKFRLCKLINRETNILLLDKPQPS